MLEIRHENSTLEAYNTIYRNEGILLRDSFYLWLIELLKPQPGRTLLDISCGEGRLTVLAHQKGMRAMGVDFAMDGVLKGRANLAEAGWAIGDGERLPLSTHSIDYITHVGSLEHYLHPELGVQEIARILKPNGKACILLPNAYGLLGNIQHVWTTGDIFDDGQPLQRYGTRRYWSSLLENGGLRIERTVGYGEVEFPRTSKDAIRLVTHPQKLARLAVLPLIPLNLANHLVFLCSRA